MLGIPFLNHFPVLRGLIPLGVPAKHMASVWLSEILPMPTTYGYIYIQMYQGPENLTHALWMQVHKVRGLRLHADKAGSICFSVA